MHKIGGASQLGIPLCAAYQPLGTDYSRNIVFDLQPFNRADGLNKSADSSVFAEGERNGARFNAHARVNDIQAASVKRNSRVAHAGPCKAERCRGELHFLYKASLEVYAEVKMHEEITYNTADSKNNGENSRRKKQFGKTDDLFHYLFPPAAAS